MRHLTGGRGRRRLLGALLIAGTIAVAPNAAAAHTSGYCGHGSSGTINITRYEGSDQLGPTSPHMHLYSHTTITLAGPTPMHANVWKQCARH